MKKKFEFSKLVIGLLIATYFIVLALGMFVTVKLIVADSTSSVNTLIGLFSYVGTVNSIAIPFYLHKSEKENLNKYPNIQTMDDYKTFNNIQQNDQTNDANMETEVSANESEIEGVNK